MDVGYLPLSLFFIVDAASHGELVTQPARLAVSESQGSSLSASLMLGLQVQVIPHGMFPGCLGSKLRSSCLCEKHFINLTISAAFHPVFSRENVFCICNMKKKDKRKIILMTSISCVVLWAFSLGRCENKSNIGLRPTERVVAV